jgi:aminoglycoside phosphotransferase (APT) family kinase protein
MDMGFAWVRAHPIGPDRPRSIIHGDYSVHNMMARDRRLAGVIDWELAEENDPAIDLAEARMLLVEDTLPWKEFVAEYLAAGGDPKACEPQAIKYHCAWMYTEKYGLMMADARNCFLSGARADALMASVASHSMDRIFQYLARGLSVALSSDD